MMALAEVSEASARGRVGDIYADIRATLRVPVVNSIYRQLAVMPEALEWAWLSVRPHLLSGAVARQAEVLRRDVQRVLDAARPAALPANVVIPLRQRRSEEHTSELPSLMRISYAGFCLKIKKKKQMNQSAQIQ